MGGEAESCVFGGLRGRPTLRFGVGVVATGSGVGGGLFCSWVGAGFGAMAAGDGATGDAEAGGLLAVGAVGAAGTGGLARADGGGA